MPRYPTLDPFLRRLRWLTIAAITAPFFLYALSWADREFLKDTAAPRPVTARGGLAADEKLTIELFERSRDSVLFISSSEQP